MEFEGHYELQIEHLGDEILRLVHCLRDGSEFNGSESLEVALVLLHRIEMLMSACHSQ